MVKELSNGFTVFALSLETVSTERKGGLTGKCFATRVAVLFRRRAELACAAGTAAPTATRHLQRLTYSLFGIAVCQLSVFSSFHLNFAVSEADKGGQAHSTSQLL
jgi:hypothetical protein